MSQYNYFRTTCVSFRFSFIFLLYSSTILIHRVTQIKLQRAFLRKFQLLLIILFGSPCTCLNTFAQSSTPRLQLKYSSFSAYIAVVEEHNNHQQYSNEYQFVLIVVYSATFFLQGDVCKITTSNWILRCIIIENSITRYRFIWLTLHLNLFSRDYLIGGKENLQVFIATFSLEGLYELVNCIVCSTVIFITFQNPYLSFTCPPKLASIHKMVLKQCSGITESIFTEFIGCH